MRVRATKLGHYDHKRIREGQVFELKTVQGHRKNKDGKLTPIILKPEQQFSESWMERLEASPKADAPVKGRAKKNEVEQEISTDDDVI